MMNLRNKVQRKMPVITTLAVSVLMGSVVAKEYCAVSPYVYPKEFSPRYLEQEPSFDDPTVLSKVGSLIDMQSYMDWLTYEPSDPLPPDYYLSFKEIVEQAGFNFESHPVTTPDGYILNVYRILNDAVASGE